jgi:hypothetical protein
MTTTAQIASKGTNGTGITEDLAQSLHNQLGKKLLCVVELVAEARSEKRNGDEKVVLSILTVEPAPNGMTADHLRELARAFHYERKLGEEGPTLQLPGDSPEPTVEEVTAAGAAHRPHEFAVDQFDEGECNICGQAEDTPVHASASQLADPFSIADTAEDEDDDQPANPDDPSYEAHEFIPDADGNCDDGCGQAADAPIHANVETDVTEDNEAPVPA